MVEEYTSDEDLFFEDFAAAFAKLISLGVPTKSKGGVLGLIQSLLAMIGIGSN